MIGGQRVAVLVPAYDEESSLPRLLAAIPRPAVGEVVVVDNGSRDATAAVAERLGAMVVREPRRGYGAACLAGIRRLAEGRPPPDIIVFMDADWNGEPSDVERLAAPIAAGTADLVLGVRGAGEGGHASAVPWHARAGNRLVLGLARVLFGRRFRDVGPFRAIRFRSLVALAMDDRDWGWTLQMQIRAARRGLRVVELAVAHRGRAAGRSKISGNLAGSARAGAKMLYTVFRERLARRS